jgi:DNA-binding transcriptional MerR regulator
MVLTVKPLSDKPESVNDEEYMFIKEFSEIVKISQDAIRYMEAKDVLRPAARGQSGSNSDNYRRYAFWQITAINMVRVLTDIKVTLEEIATLNTERTPEKMLKLFSRQKHLMRNNLRLYEDAHLVLETVLELLMESVCASEDEIALIERPARQITLGGINDYGDSASFYEAFISFCLEKYDPPLNLSFPIGGYHTSMAEFLKAPSRPTRYLSLNPKGLEEMPAGLYLTGYTRGSYGQTNDLPERMKAFAEEEGLVFIGPVYQIYVQDEISVVDKNNYLLQASALVKETRRNLPKRVPPFFNGN